MKYKVIEDCSPFFIRFTWENIESLIDWLRNQQFNGVTKRYYDYEHINLNEPTATEILNQLPMANVFDFMRSRVAIFDTPPGGGCGIHKDGPCIRMGINIPIHVSDNMCQTSWYLDDQFIDAPVAGNSMYSRNVFPNYKDMKKFNAAKTVTFSPNEAVLFNTEIFHAWTNEGSSNNRSILTLRVNNPGNVYFEDAKNLLFHDD